MKQILGTNKRQPLEIRDLTDELIAEANAYKPVVKVKEKPITIKPSNVNSLENYWTINNVFYNGESKNYNLSKILLENKTQSEHIEYAKQNPSDFIIRDLPFYTSLFQAIKNLPDSLKEKQKMKEFIKKSFKDYYLMTATRANYNSTGKDEVEHLISGIKQEATIVGPDEYITKINKEELFEKLTGIKDLTKLNELYKYFTDKDSKIWRVNFKPNKLEQRVVRFDSDDVGFGFDAYIDLCNSSRCFGVRG